MQRTIPGVLWIALVSGGIMALGKAIAAFYVGPLVLIDAALTAILLVGIYRGFRWAYVLILVLIAVGALVGFQRGIDHGLMVLLVDSLVYVPLIVSTDYFFADAGKEAG